MTRLKINKKKKGVLIVTASTLMAGAIVFGAISVWSQSKPFNAQAERIALVAEQIKVQYVLNEQITLPESVEMQYGGKTVVASKGLITYPSGFTKSVGEMILDEMGQYTVTYYIQEGNLTHEAVKTFVVKNAPFVLSQPEGSWVETSSVDNTLHSKKDGIILNLKEGCTFTYNKPVDLRECGDNGLIDVAEFDLRYGAMNEQGKYEPNATTCWVRMTDCYNPDIWVDCEFWRSDKEGNLYLSVKTSNQSSVALDVGSTRTMLETGQSKWAEVDGKTCFCWTSEKYGIWGGQSYLTNANTGIKLQMDYATQRIYFTWGTRDSTLLTDLDSTGIYGGNIFKGFTTGEVYVSFRGDGYSEQLARTEVISIGHYDAQTLMDVNEEYLDERKPEVQIQAQKTHPKGIYGAIGDTVKIPEAIVYDVNLVGEVEIAVYTGYGTTNANRVSIQDGTFKIDSKDTYTVVYTAKDGAGNCTVETFDVVAKQTSDNRAICLEYEKLDGLTTGVRTTLPEHTLSSINNVEDVQLKIVVSSENQTVLLDETRTFIPQYKGEYTITYTYGDGINAYEYSYKVNSIVENGVVSFLDIAELPRYLVKGASYKFDSLSAYEYSSGAPVQTATEAYILFDGNKEKKIDDISSVLIEGSQTAQLIFKSGTATAVSQVVKIVDTGWADNVIRMRDYFVHDNFTVQTQDPNTGRVLPDIKYKSTLTEGDNKLSFLHAIPYKSFIFGYSMHLEDYKFETLRLRLTSVKNANSFVTIDLSQKMVLQYDANAKAMVEVAETYLSVNNAPKQRVYNFTLADGINKNISYKWTTEVLQLGSVGVSQALELEGELCYLDVELLGLYGEAEILIAQVNNQQLKGNQTRDNSAPEITVTDSQGHYVLGEVATIYAPVLSDAFSPIDYSKCAFSVKMSDGTKVFDTQGVDLTSCDLFTDYKIKFEKLGTYIVTYTAIDLKGQKSTRNYYLECIDFEKPTIVWGKGLSENDTITAKVGSTITIDYTITDNISESANITSYVHVYRVETMSYKNDTGKSIKFTQKGDYYIEIVASDEAGNMTWSRIKVVII